jgi:hypothetical protein
MGMKGLFVIFLNEYLTDVSWYRWKRMEIGKVYPGPFHVDYADVS